jgi:hypothetical protein
MSRADLDAQRARFIADMEAAGHAEDMDLGWLTTTNCFADKGARQAFIGWQAALAAQAPVPCGEDQEPRRIADVLMHMAGNDLIFWHGTGSDEDDAWNTDEEYRATLAAVKTALAAQAPENHALDTTTDLLLDVARLAHDAMDGTEENDTGLHWNRTDFDALSEAMDKLDALPDDRLGYVMGPAAKAAWALKASSVRVATIAAQAPVQGEPVGSLEYALKYFEKAYSAKRLRDVRAACLDGAQLMRTAIDAARKAAKP